MHPDLLLKPGNILGALALKHLRKEFRNSLGPQHRQMENAHRIARDRNSFRGVPCGGLILARVGVFTGQNDRNADSKDGSKLRHFFT